LPENIFRNVVMPGTPCGSLLSQVKEEVGGIDPKVISVAAHDTGSAVVAVPAKGEKFIFISSGTWSIMGTETKQPVISEKSNEYNFTNEGGIGGTTRFLKNICGMWLLERCRQEWTDAPADVNEINSQVMEVEPFRSLVNPDDPRFANPESMVDAIQDFCRETGQPVPEDYRQTARCIFESQALRYRQVLGYLKQLAPFPIERLHVIGGGTYNRYLMQMTADSIGLPVTAGPAEGTAIGNIMLQAKAAGLVGDTCEMRRVIADSIETDQYQPVHSADWDNAYEKFTTIQKQ